VVGVEFWPWEWVTLKEIESKDADVCVTLDILAENLKTVV
jgi:hypothetical protein